MKFQILDVYYINKCIEWLRENRISLRVVMRGRRGTEEGRKTNNGKRSAIEMTPAKQS
jgi:hypothetical protein